MTDQIPADKVEKIATAMRAAMRRDEHAYPEAKFLADLSGYIKDLETLLPPPPRPTLADMTEEERASCKWMQADVKGDEITAGIIAMINPADAHLIASDGDTWFLALDTVTPRPDLPRMEWPGDKKPTPAPSLPDGWRLADHRKYGRVIVTNPNQESDGYSYCIFSSDMDSAGFDWYPCAPDTLTYIDQEADTPTGPDHLAVGTVIESADDPRIAALPDGSVLLDRDRETVGKRKEVWMGDGYIPRPSERDEFGPWTVRRIGWEDDQ